MRRRRLILSSLLVLPLALFVLMTRQSSWRPRTLWVGASNLTLEFSANDQTLIVAQRESSRASVFRQFQLWDVSSRTRRRTLASPRFNSNVLVLSDDQSVVAGVVDTDSIKVWDVPTGQLRRTLSHPLSTGISISSLAVSPDNQILAEGRGDGGTYNPPYLGQVLLWDLRTGTLHQTLDSGGNTVSSFLFSPDGRTLIGAGMYAVQIWDVQRGALRCKLGDNALLAPQVALSSNGQTLATVDGRNLIELWNPRTGALRHRLPRLKDDVFQIALDWQGKTLVSVSNGTGAPAPPPGATSFSYSEPGVAVNGEVNVCDTRTGQRLRTFSNEGRALREVAFLPDSQMVVSGSDGEVTL